MRNLDTGARTSGAYLTAWCAHESNMAMIFTRTVHFPRRKKNCTRFPFQRTPQTPFELDFQCSKSDRFPLHVTRRAYKKQLSVFSTEQQPLGSAYRTRSFSTNIRIKPMPTFEGNARFTQSVLWQTTPFSSVVRKTRSESISTLVYQRQARTACFGMLQFLYTFMKPNSNTYHKVCARYSRMRFSDVRQNTRHRTFFLPSSFHFIDQHDSIPENLPSHPGHIEKACCENAVHSFRLTVDCRRRTSVCESIVYSKRFRTLLSKHANNDGCGYGCRAQLYLLPISLNDCILYG